MSLGVVVSNSKKYWVDVAERIGWQIAYAAVASGIIIGVPAIPDKAAYGPALMIILSALKLLVAKHVGDPSTAAIGTSATTAPTDSTILPTI